MCKVLIIYDSLYGNTQKIAKAMAAMLAPPDCVTLKPVDSITTEDYRRAELVIIGSPTHGGQPTGPLHEFLASLSPGAMDGKAVASFDTRFKIDQHGRGMHILMKSIGFAAPKLAKQLQKLGGQLVVEPEGFFVEDKKGPLLPGELARAGAWFSKIIKEGYETTQRTVKADR